MMSSTGFRHLIVVFSPRLSPSRLRWAFYEFKRIAAIPEAERGWIERQYLKKMDKRLHEQMGRRGAYIPVRITVGRDVLFHHEFHGIHIADNAVIGDGCEILQNVTIGSNFRGDGAAPVIGNNVFIGAGANIIGRCKIGDGAKIARAGVTLVQCDRRAGRDHHQQGGLQPHSKGLHLALNVNAAPLAPACSRLWLQCLKELDRSAACRGRQLALPHHAPRA